MACERRLIDANKLQHLLLPIATGLEHEYGSLGGAVSGVMKHIDSAPTVDAEEVVHGRLSDPYIDEYYGEFSNCLECGTDNILPCYYCRKCGAKMDGGARDGL